jgi:hypothetical protein
MCYAAAQQQLALRIRSLNEMIAYRNRQKGWGGNPTAQSCRVHSAVVKFGRVMTSPTHPTTPLSLRNRRRVSLRLPHLTLQPECSSAQPMQGQVDQRRRSGGCSVNSIRRRSDHCTNPNPRVDPAARRCLSCCRRRSRRCRRLTRCAAAAVSVPRLLRRADCGHPQRGRLGARDAVLYCFSTLRHESAEARGGRKGLRVGAWRRAGRVH